MAGGNFMHRVMSYVFNEVVGKTVVEGLSNSQKFQRFAVVTSRKMEEMSKMAEKAKQEVVEKLKAGLDNMDSSKGR